MSDRISAAQLADADLDAIEEWCAGVLAQAEKGKMFAAQLCAFRRDIPTSSIRATILTLVKSTREAWGEAEAATRALRELVDACDRAAQDNSGRIHPEIIGPWRRARALVGSENRSDDG